MKLSSLFLFAMAAGYGIVSGQTNSALAPRTWFTLPPSPQLRPMGHENEFSNQLAIELVSLIDNQPADAASAATPTSANNSAATENWRDDRFPDRMALDSRTGEFDYQSYRLIYEGAYLNRPEPESDDLFSRVVTGVFKPEPFQIGRTTACCSVFTAIKRKSPLCLLNPMVLNISW